MAKIIFYEELYCGPGFGGGPVVTLHIDEDNVICFCGLYFLPQMISQE